MQMRGSMVLGIAPCSLIQSTLSSGLYSTTHTQNRKRVGHGPCSWTCSRSTPPPARARGRERLGGHGFQPTPARPPWGRVLSLRQREHQAHREQQRLLLRAPTFPPPRRGSIARSQALHTTARFHRPPFPSTPHTSQRKRSLIMQRRARRRIPYPWRRGLRSS